LYIPSVSFFLTSRLEHLFKFNAFGTACSACGITCYAFDTARSAFDTACSAFGTAYYAFGKVCSAFDTACSAFSACFIFSFPVLPSDVP
jgi:hypothetical protein